MKILILMGIALIIAGVFQSSTFNGLDAAGWALTFAATFALLRARRAS